MQKHLGKDLVAGYVYKSSDPTNIKEEVISKLLNVGNAGGFRRLRQQIDGKPIQQLAYVCLFSTGQEPEWKDSFDEKLGIYTYCGDNRKPGNDILNTKQKGNIFLEKIFFDLSRGNRFLIPPVFIFNKTNGRDVKFVGLAVPGCSGQSAGDCLKRIKFTTPSGSYENYQAVFTILNVKIIHIKWILALQLGQGLFSPSAPSEWLCWIEDGTYLPLLQK